MFGKYDEKGAIAQDTRICILTGRAVDALNSVRERVTGTPYFYRVAGSQYHRVTDELRAGWQKQALALEKPARKVEGKE